MAIFGNMHIFVIGSLQQSFCKFRIEEFKLETDKTPFLKRKKNAKFVQQKGAYSFNQSWEIHFRTILFG